MMDLREITQQVALLTEKIDQLLKNSPEIEHPYQSEELKDLYTALSKAQGEYAPVNYNRENPYFKSQYADLDAIIKAVRPALTKYGLAFVQQMRFNPEGMTILHSRLTHSSGQWIESRARIIPPKNDIQTFGSTLTYHKRYAAISLLGVTISHDMSDDDAEVAMVSNREIVAKGTSLNAKYNPKEQSYEPITKEQLDELEYELQGHEDIAEMVLNGLHIQNLCDMPKTKFRASAERIREIKRTREGK